MESKKIAKQELYQALLQPGDSVNFSEGGDGIVHSGVFDGYLERGGLRFTNVDGSDTGRHTWNPVFYEGGVSLEELLLKRGKENTASYVNFVRGAQMIVDQNGGSPEDADTVLGQFQKKTKFCAVAKGTGLASDILKIWNEAKEKEPVEKMFEAIFGVSFLEYLVTASRALIG